jgi:ribosome-associated protein
MTLPIRLDHFLQHAGFAQTGGHAKLLIQDGGVCVNGSVEMRRRCKLKEGDVVLCEGLEKTVRSS